MMRARAFDLLAFCLALALMPGVLEVVENASHLLTQGHLAHAAEHGDHHDSGGPEHGCTPSLHLCSCHASLVYFQPRALPSATLALVGRSKRLALPVALSGFRAAIDHPPQV